MPKDMLRIISWITSESIFELTQRYKIILKTSSHRPPFPSKVNETWAGSQPFQYGNNL